MPQSMYTYFFMTSRPRIKPIKDRQTVTSDFQSVQPLIKGVNLRRMPPIEDERGEVVEVYRPSWGFHPDPLVYIYQIGMRPKAIKGWVIHEKQDDRIFVSRGVVRWVLYDHRADSPTHKLMNDFTFSDRNRVLMTIPRGVFHAVQNIGETEATFLNMPTQPYNHEDPDKFRLPINNDLIPFDFNDPPRW
jgi:dTDP-4-dehydrorhamnose 3,5-epimerase